MGNYYLYIIGQFLAQNLPLKVSNFLVMVLCDLHYSFSRTDRHAVENNLRVVLMRTDVSKEEVRAVFRNFGRCLLEFFTMNPAAHASFIESRVHVRNIELLNKALQKGKGVILVSAHLGNWEIGGTVLAAMGYPLSVVALAHKDPRVNALFNSRRESFGVQVIQADVAVRHVVQDLRKNRIVAILADRDFGNRGMVMEFLGRKTMIPKGAAFFSIKTGAPIIPIFFTRTSDDRFDITIYPPHDPPYLPDNKLTDEKLQENTRLYLTRIEDEIRKYPSQWLIFREFWQS